MIRAEFDPRAARRAGNGAGDQHRRMVQGLRRQVGGGGFGEKPGQSAGNRHRALLLLFDAEA